LALVAAVPALAGSRASIEIDDEVVEVETRSADAWIVEHSASHPRRPGIDKPGAKNFRSLGFLGDSGFQWSPTVCPPGAGSGVDSDR
jgi:hypothetical protein